VWLTQLHREAIHAQPCIYKFHGGFNVHSGCTTKPRLGEESLLKRDTEWSTLASAGKDVDKVVSYWSTDAVVYPPGQPMIEGTAAIRSYVSESYKIPGFRIGWKSHDVTLSPDEKMAYMRDETRFVCQGKMES